MTASEEEGTINRQEINSLISVQNEQALELNTSAASANSSTLQPQLLNLQSNAYISTINRSRLDGLNFNERQVTDRMFFHNTLTPIQSQEDLASNNSNAAPSVFVFRQSPEMNGETSGHASPQTQSRKRPHTTMEPQIFSQTQLEIPKSVRCMTPPAASTSSMTQNFSFGSPRMTFSPTSYAQRYNPRSGYGSPREQINRRNSPRETPQETQHNETCDSPRTVYPTATPSVFNSGLSQPFSPIPKNVDEPSQYDMINAFASLLPRTPVRNIYSLISSPRKPPVPNKYTLPSIPREPPVPNEYNLPSIPRPPPLPNIHSLLPSPITHPVPNTCSTIRNEHEFPRLLTDDPYGLLTQNTTSLPTNFPHIASPFNNTPPQTPQFEFWNQDDSQRMEEEIYWGPGIQNLEMIQEDTSMDTETSLNSIKASSSFMHDAI